MRSVSVRACGAAFLLLLVLSSAVPAFADEPSDTVVLQGRIHMPPGLATEQDDELALWNFFLVWLQGRIHVPG
jgi:hypothetical protein